MKYTFKGWYTQQVTGTYTIEVEAYSEDEAKEAVKRGLGDVFFTEKACEREQFNLDESEVTVND